MGASRSNAIPSWKSCAETLMHKRSSRMRNAVVQGMSTRPEKKGKADGPRQATGESHAHQFDEEWQALSQAHHESARHSVAKHKGRGRMELQGGVVRGRIQGCVALQCASSRGG